ncbi:1-acyl-sn-glycerol-3-phosphate acyltransferase [Vibrio coralliirubri]|uniref:1-acyl-sn-glycerol-3-phosphate acyltransferase n=1 Tax=Vibrio coralliirubri TaxID=1516159 RepID=UPI002284057C|nr:1-acyl-sn-glycerol-3-phosphate acyltransferase [Vibrio coralliirubri]MCY9861146.1 1-acyl-sn-glycerol-3-phosphate acyltransferase [Vibrio coralliirubri]
MNFISRVISKVVSKLLYRLKIKGFDQIPTTGGAVLAPNHVSYMDALILLSVCKRPVKFVMWYKIYDKPLLKWFFKRVGVIPIASPKENMKVFRRSFELIKEALDGGELVVFFPEGAITRDGNLQEVKGGIEYVINGSPVPVVPVGIRGLYGSYFSRSNNKPFFGKLFSQISIEFGSPILPKQLNRQSVHYALRQLTHNHT